MYTVLFYLRNLWHLRQTIRVLWETPQRKLPLYVNKVASGPVNTDPTSTKIRIATEKENAAIEWASCTG
jgi:hypothetical protein